MTFVDNGDGTGTLSGTPAAGTGGVYALTFTAANGVLPNATQAFTLTVNEAPAITSATVMIRPGADAGGDRQPAGAATETALECAPQ